MATAGLVWSVLSGAGCAAGDFGEDLSEDPLPSEFRDLVIVTTPDVVRIPAPLPAAHCSIKVVGQQSYDIESDYLPRTVYCENGGGDIEALKAQAIAARSVVYYEASLDGSICDSESCQHASCIGNSASATLAKVPEEVFRAVRETSGTYLKYGDTLTYAFYVAGSKTFHGQTCIGDAGGAPTEKWVTYNNGKSDALVEQTKLGSVFVPSDNEYGQNRGCMSQWGARCLEQDGADALDILEFYYGEDIEVVKAQGDCIEDTPPVGEASECGDGQCTGDENSDRCPTDCEPCGVVADQGETIVDEGSSCFSTTGDEQYIRHEAGRGHDGGLLWTESTQSVAHTAGTWRMNFEKAGRYRVEAFIEASYAQEDRARYRVTHDGEESTLRVDQSRARGWVELGVFGFASGEHDQGVMLTDLSGTRGNTIVFDAIRIAKVEGDDEKFDDVEPGARGGGEEGCSLGAPDRSDPRTIALMLVVVAASRRRQRSRRPSRH